MINGLPTELYLSDFSVHEQIFLIIDAVVIIFFSKYTAPKNEYLYSEFQFICIINLLGNKYKKCNPYLLIYLSAGLVSLLIISPSSKQTNIFQYLNRTSLG